MLDHHKNFKLRLPTLRKDASRKDNLANVESATEGGEMSPLRDFSPSSDRMPQEAMSGLNFSGENRKAATPGIWSTDDEVHGHTDSGSSEHGEVASATPVAIVKPTGSPRHFSGRSSCWNAFQTLH